MVGEVFPLHILDLASQRGQGWPGEEGGWERFPSSCLLSSSYFSCLLPCLRLSNRDTAFIPLYSLEHYSTDFLWMPTRWIEIFHWKRIYHIIHSYIHESTLRRCSRCTILNVLGCIVGKKWDPGILDPSRFSAQIRKVEARLGKLAKIRKVETN